MYTPLSGNSFNAMPAFYSCASSNVDGQGSPAVFSFDVGIESKVLTTAHGFVGGSAVCWGHYNDRLAITLWLIFVGRVVDLFL